MSSIILEAKSLTKEYKQTLALDHINLQIKKPSCYARLGCFKYLKMCATTFTHHPLPNIL